MQARSSVFQAFLHVPATGTFDAATENAVAAFQSQYLSDVMGPWGVTTPTGVVYITTKNKLNELACNQSFALTAADLAIINAYKANASAQPTNGTTGSVGTSTSPVSPLVGVNSTTSPNQALVGAVGTVSSVWANIWKAIKKLF